MPPLPVLSPSSQQVSHRLATLPRREKGETLRELEARTLLDAFYIQLGQARQVETKPTAFASLFCWVPTALGNASSHHAYWGEAVCLCTEVDEGLSEDDLNELATVIAEKGLGQPVKRRVLEGIQLPIGFFVLVPDAKPEAMVLLYFPSAAHQASRFVHLVMPQLLLSLIKARLIAEEYRYYFLPKVHRQEQELDATLKQAANPRLHLEALERLSANISRQQATFIEGISTLEEQLQTLRVCMRNVELLLDDVVWGEQRQWARQALTGNMVLLIEQMETDLRYLRITQQQADLALQSLLTITGVRGTQWERRITLLLGLFAVMAVAQVFPELAWWWRLALIGLGGTVVGLARWWLRRDY